MKDKKMLILRGGVKQSYLAKRAKREGYYVIVCDEEPDASILEYTDKLYRVDYTRREEALKIAQEECVQGVLSNSDSAMASVAYVSEQMGLIGNTLESVETLCSKARFRKLQKRLGLLAPECAETFSYEEAIEQGKQFTFPVIIKANDGYGSIGTKKLLNYQELLDSQMDWEACSANSADGKVVLEEYVKLPSGDVVAGDIFVLGSTILWDGLSSEKRSKYAEFFSMTQTFPVCLSQEELDEVKATVTALLRGAGITFGEYEVELFYTQQHELFCIEINARQGGIGIPFMIRQHCGIDMTRLLVTTAMGDNSYFDEVCAKKHDCRYITRQPVMGHRDGIYDGLYISEDIRPFIIRIKEVFSHAQKFKTDETLLREGDYKELRTRDYDIVAYVDMEFKSREQQLNFVNQIEDHIKALII